MERKQFTFYRSYYEAVKELPKKEQCAVILAICAYALDEKEPELTGTAKAIFSLVRPTLDSSRRKAESGKAGGKAKQTESKPKANAKQTEREKENEIENKKENEIENECYNPQPPEAEVEEAVSYFLDRVNPMASQTCLDELVGYARVMGAAVCKRAMDIALDNKSAKWSYIKAILADKQSRGVRCLSDWDDLEKERDEQNAAAVRGNSGGKAGAGADKQWNLKSAFDD